MAASVSAATLQAAAVTAFIELALIAFVCAVLVLVLSAISRRAAATRNQVIGTLAPLAAVKSRKLVIALSALAAVAVVLYNGWLAANWIEGITAFGPTSMTIRTSTRVKPGYHDAVAAAMRLLIKETFDAESGETLRKSLIPERWAPGPQSNFSYAGPEQAPSRTRGLGRD